MLLGAVLLVPNLVEGFVFVMLILLCLMSKPNAARNSLLANPSPPD